VKTGRVNQRSPYLKRWMEERGQRADTIATAIGLTPAQMYNRLRGDKPFRLYEANAICTFLGQSYSTLFPDHSGIDPRDIEALKYAPLVGVA
jgi:transcriptional regulator with XRE-family HTH domain